MASSLRKAALQKQPQIPRGQLRSFFQKVYSLYSCFFFCCLLPLSIHAFIDNLHHCGLSEWVSMCFVLCVACYIAVCHVLSATFVCVVCFLWMLSCVSYECLLCRVDFSSPQTHPFPLLQLFRSPIYAHLCCVTHHSNVNVDLLSSCLFLLFSSLRFVHFIVLCTFHSLFRPYSSVY